MHPSPLLCALLAFWSVLGFYKSISPILLVFILMERVCNQQILTQLGDFGCEFFMIRCSSNLLLFFVMFGLGLRVLQFGGFTRFMVCNHKFDNKKNVGEHNLEENEEFEGEDEEEHKCIENEVFNVIDLQKMVKDQRRRTNAALNDLDKERMAAASAAEEAMSMILRLQNEKSSAQIEAKQLRRIGEEKQAYDQEMIQSLQRLLMQCEEERSLLEQQLRLCKKRLRMHLKEDENELIECMTSPCSRSLSRRSRMAGCRLDDLLGGCLD